MTSCRTRGLILQVYDHGESDKIVTFFSPDIGKASAIAKGAKRSKKRFVNKLEIFSLLGIIYRPARRDSLLFLDEAELENGFIPLRHAYDRYVAAIYAGELTLRFTREMDPHPELFPLLLWAMHSLTEGREPLETAALFHLRILRAAGYEPALDRCGICNGGIQAGGEYALHPGSGSLVCGRCRQKQALSFLSLSVQTIKFLGHAQQTELPNLGRLRLPRKNALEALAVLHRYTQHLLQHDIHSWHQIIKPAAALQPAGR
ncbi:MAG: DNA repair protein RecO [Desulfobulbaceae bacterium]|jgi:DNA repair protein RecO (recombination protein O)|nr:DNA repair protein RecO [Desulfobulbaceae bacterium]MDY0351059.1 DNA repair protein RecO [Desulfobulbaceae bacterium]